MKYLEAYSFTVSIMKMNDSFPVFFNISCFFSIFSSCAKYTSLAGPLSLYTTFSWFAAPPPPFLFFGNCPSSFVFSPKIQNYFSLQFEQKITIEDIVYQTTIVKYKSYFRAYSRHRGHGCDF